jgi:hypothetical protein
MRGEGATGAAVNSEVTLTDLMTRSCFTVKTDRRLPF